MALPLATEVTPTDVVVETPVAPTEADEVLPFKLSLPTEEDAAAWRQAGFRLQLGVGYGMLRGIDGTPGDKNLPALRTWLINAIEQFGDKDPVIIRPTPDTRHERIIDVLNAAAAAKVKNLTFS